MSHSRSMSCSKAPCFAQTAFAPYHCLLPLTSPRTAGHPYDKTCDLNLLIHTAFVFLFSPRFAGSRQIPSFSSSSIPKSETSPRCFLTRRGYQYVCLSPIAHRTQPLTQNPTHDETSQDQPTERIDDGAEGNNSISNRSPRLSDTGVAAERAGVAEEHEKTTDQGVTTRCEIGRIRWEVRQRKGPAPNEDHNHEGNVADHGRSLVNPSRRSSMIYQVRWNNTKPNSVDEVSAQRSCRRRQGLKEQPALILRRAGELQQSEAQGEGGKRGGPAGTLICFRHVVTQTTPKKTTNTIKNRVRGTDRDHQNGKTKAKATCTSTSVVIHHVQR